MKYCPKCDTSKNESEFHNNKARHDKLETYCKPCKIEVTSTYQKTTKGKAVMRKSRMSERGRANANARVKRWHRTEKGRTYVNQYNSERWHADLDYNRLKRRARAAGVAIGILKQVLKRDKVCQLCHTDQDLQFDHVFPVSLGGKGSLENLQILCSKCNKFKSNNLFLPTGGMIVTGKQQTIR